MKVYELIELLQEFDPDAEVFLGHQPEWPFEYTISGVAERRMFALDEIREELEYNLPEDLNEREEMIGKFESDPDYGEDWNGRQLQGSDVLILDGSQTRYGNRAAWDTALV